MWKQVSSPIKLSTNRAVLKIALLETWGEKDHFLLTVFEKLSGPRFRGQPGKVPKYFWEVAEELVWRCSQGQSTGRVCGLVWCGENFKERRGSADQVGRVGVLNIVEGKRNGSGEREGW